MPDLFKSFFLGGFECSTHKRRDGIRLDLIAISGHDAQAQNDYRALATHGMHAARDGLRWHLIERRRGIYDWSSLLLQLHGARATGCQLIWDLFHYGWPNGADIWSPGFVDRFAAFCRAAAAVVRDETEGIPWFCAVNEMSFLAWAGGDTGGVNPFGRNRGDELKTQLVRMAIAAIEAVRDVVPGARFITAEPLINIVPPQPTPGAIQAAQDYFDAQFEATDLLAGRLRPELGGRPEYLDVVGLNYYYNNQWIDHGLTVFLGDARHRPLHQLLAIVHERYGRPMLIAETGTEGVFRAPWLHHVADQVAAAMMAGIPIEGICLYPVLSHRGWDDERHCPNGLFEAFTPNSSRVPYRPLATELARQQDLFSRGVLDRG